jgi:hypothetical protein
VTEAGTWARRRHRRPRPPRQPTRGRTCEGGGREHQSNQQHLCSTSCVVPGALAIRAPLPSASWGEGCRSGAGEQPRGVCQDSVLLVRLPASPAWCCMAQCPRDKAATNKLRIVTCGFGTARQKMALERWTNPKPQRSTRSPRYGVPSCRGESAGVAKRPRERPPTRNPYPLRFATCASLDA